MIINKKTKFFKNCLKKLHTSFIKGEGEHEKIYLKSHNIQKSFWHDISLKDKDYYNMVVEIPALSRIIREMNKDEEFNPIKVKINKPSNGPVINTRDYSKDPIINYGFFPQTFSTKEKKFRGIYKGDNDPLDVIDVGGPFNKSAGDLMKVKILGSFCLIDQGEMDWKILVASEGKLEDYYEKILYVQHWFKIFKTFFGKKENEILDNNKLFSIEETIKVIEESHLDYNQSQYFKIYQSTKPKLTYSNPKTFEKIDVKKVLTQSAINFHFTRVCNYECKFCFHTKKSSYLLPIEKQIELLKIFKDSGAEKINFAGGEPFLFPEILGELVKAAKQMGYDSTSIISNGSKIKKEWFEKYGEWLDILGISCDSLNVNVNFNHGRKTAGSHARDERQKFINLSNWSKEKNILFKINTVVTSLNKNENLSEFINEINPIRWKVFQVLDVEGENYTSDNKENIKNLLITKNEFDNFCELNRNGLKNKEILIPESNDLMRSSYILVDEYGRLLDSSTGGKIPTQSILDVGLDQAINELLSSDGNGFHRDTYFLRGGYYPEKWNKMHHKF